MAPASNTESRIEAALKALAAKHEAEDALYAKEEPEAAASDPNVCEAAAEAGTMSDADFSILLSSIAAQASVKKPTGGKSGV